jgi:hypothetical protein
MNKSYVKDIRLYFYISCSKIAILINDHQPTNHPKRVHYTESI